jgi:hypothetical protein
VILYVAATTTPLPRTSCASLVGPLGETPDVGRSRRYAQGDEDEKKRGYYGHTPSVPGRSSSANEAGARMRAASIDEGQGGKRGAK